jgi:hypothetical protein
MPIRRRPQLRLERLEDRVQPSVEPINGVGNNVANPNWGAAGTDLIRLSPVGYADGISTPALPSDQSARAISNILNNQANPTTGQDINTVDQQGLSDFGYVFGQFIDHDIDLTPDGGAALNIPVSANDPIGPNDLPFTRSQFDSHTGTSTANPRQQVTDITAYLDLSQVYGSDAATADALRTHSGGQLKTSPGNMLPYFNSDYFTAAQLAAINAAVGGMANDGAVPNTSLFVTGDTRGNENIELTAMQTLFLRNHNRIAAKLQLSHPGWSDEQLYQEARKLNIAQYQAIVYTEWLPAVLGPNAIRPYSGYKANVNASIANEFSTIAFRFGHSLLDNQIERHTDSGTDLSIAGGSDIPLAFDFFNSTLLNPAGVSDPYTDLTSTGIDPILKADADGTSQAMDLNAVDAVRNLLFGNAGAGGEDLMARDVQRDRDNGIADYNTLRAAYGLPRVTSFAQITSNVQVQQELAAAYPDVNHIDAFEGGLAEDHVPGSDLGPLFQRIIADQFTRLRDGDRFFSLNEQMTTEEMKIIGQGNSLSKVIEANSGVRNLQGDVFHFRSSISGQVFNDANQNGRPDRGEMGLPRVTVQLVNAGDGSVVATKQTDGNGIYQFTAQDGYGTGRYLVREVLPSGWTQTTAAPGTLAVTRGDTNIGGVNFGDYTGGPSNTPIAPPPGCGSTQPPSPPTGGQQHLPPPPPPMFQPPGPAGTPSGGAMTTPPVPGTHGDASGPTGPMGSGDLTQPPPPQRG